MQVLIDPRSTHSFVSHSLPHCLELELGKLGCPMIVSTPFGKQVESCKGYEGGRIILGDSEFSVELTFLDI